MKKTILSFIFVIGSIVGFSQSLYEYTDLSNYRVKVGELVLNGQKMRPITPLVNQVLMYDGFRWKNQNEKDLIFAADSANIVKYVGNDRDLDLGANSINTDTVKIDGVPLLLNTFKQGNLGGASNIFYSTGASSQPTSGTVNQVVSGGLLIDKYLTRWDGTKFVNSGIYELNGNLGIGTTTPIAELHIKKNTTEASIIVENDGGLGGAAYEMVDNASGARWKFKTTNMGDFKIRNTFKGFDVFYIDSLTNEQFSIINNNVGIGTTTPSARIHSQSTGTQLRLGYDATNYTDLSTGSTGNLTIDPTGDTVKVNKNLIVTGEIYNEINHLYGMIYDSTIILTLTKNVWQQVTNTTKTLYSTSEQDGITILGDTIVFSKAGGYDVYFEFNNVGIDKKEYHYRILQKNGSTVVRSYNKYASTGIQQVRNEKAYIQANAGEKVWCEIMSPSPVPGDVTIQGSKVYAMQRYLEK